MKKGRKLSEITPEKVQKIKGLIDKGTPLSTICYECSMSLYMLRKIIKEYINDQ